MTAHPPEIVELVARLRVLLAKATPGPWTMNGFKFFHAWKGHIYATDGENCDTATLIAACAADKPDKPFADDLQPLLWEKQQQAKIEANAALIVAAVNALPKLLDALAPQPVEVELREALIACRARFQEYVDGHLAKSTPEGASKAQRNIEMVQLCSAALKQPGEVELREALERLEKAASSALRALDLYNEKHGTFIGGPKFFELGRSTALARAALKQEVKS